ncbi:MAG: TAT-variant-translocated molybdopterin oxidoreductase [Phycisphaerales bacterium]|nr:MAG: TAT-variant-translocated molybdopterin oxidoreductase [Phycisphaerales bacterium]
MSSLMSRSQTGSAYWRSLDELADTPQFREFLHREFPAGASELLDGSGEGRRNFLKVMGASFLLAGLGLTGCRRWPQEKIVPYAKRPEGRTPGVTVRYATCMELGGIATGLLATSYDGRPIKVDGNPQHPGSRGAAGPLAQAGILDLYDPDRSATVRRSGEAVDWAAFETWAEAHFGELRSAGGGGLAVLCEATASPSPLRLKRRAAELFPQMRWHEYEPVSDDNELAGSVMAFGRPYRTHYSFNRARIIVSLDADFLGTHPAAVTYTRDFAATRRADDADRSMSRLYAFESALTLTGANADHRVALRRGDVAVIAARLAERILAETPQEVQTLAGKAIRTSLSDAELQALLDQLMHDLEGHRGEAAIVAGPAQPPEVHLLAHLMNAALGAVGRTVTYTAQDEREPHVESLRSLVDDMNGGRVSTLLIIGGNPVYDAPGDLDFTAALAKVEQTIRLGLYEDETSAACAWHLPRAHYLEVWGDGRGHDGTISIAQPLIEPLMGGRSAIEVLSLVCGEDVRRGEDIVRATFDGITGLAASESEWRNTLHAGVLAGSASPRQQPSIDFVSGHLQALADRHSAASNGSLEIAFNPCNSVYDGRFANNGWLQEMPDPLTRLTWDNALLMGVGKAKDLGLNDGDVVRVTAGGASIEAPIMVVPGQFDESITIALGYGRRFEGRICTGAGVDANPLRRSDAMWHAGGVTVEKTGRTVPMATTQDHHAIDVEGTGGADIQKRLPMLFREASLDHYREHPEFAKHGAHVVHRLSMWEENNLAGADHRWAMAIDLSACTGCNGCVMACQAENNIPIVGKDQVTRGREMQWIRVDRYYNFGKTEGEYDAGKLEGVALQPVTCHHCENAPCEQVCPVAATVHDKDGLNVMVYNRCVGTRYCSNNCPYKVRRFNYFDFHRRDPHRDPPGELLQVQPDYYTRGQAKADELHQMQFNPEVTVRMRGVMEKCTFCTQRIADARIKAKNEWVQADPATRGEAPHIPDGTIQTACQETCPARAIVFGDLNDPESEVSKLHRHLRAYGMLEEFNVKPRLHYLAKLRNPAPGLVPHDVDAAGHGDTDSHNSGGSGGSGGGGH